MLNPKKKIWESVAPDLTVNDCGVAVYKSVPLSIRSKTGSITAATLKSVAIK